MVSLYELAQELQTKVEYQETPRVLSDDEYIAMVARAIRKLYVDTGRASIYSGSLYTENEDDMEVYFVPDLGADEIEYIMILAQMEFFKMIRASVNQMVSYTTDALSVTQGDKPYANITGTLNELENERRIVYYKMVPYTIAVGE